MKAPDCGSVGAGDAGTPQGTGGWVAHLLRPQDCFLCSLCLQACYQGALTLQRGNAEPVHVDLDRCSGCGECARACSQQALELRWLEAR